jgi:hypothetical protein
VKGSEVDAPYRLEFEIPGLPKTLNQLLGAHWRTRSSHAKKWKLAVWHAVGINRPHLPLKRAHVELYRCSSKEPDTDGTRGSFKPILDGLVQCCVLSDDTPAVIGEPKCQWLKASPKQGKIIVVVTEIAHDPKSHRVAHET